MYFVPTPARTTHASIPANIASPPSLGTGFLWTRLLLGRSIAPNLFARYILSGINVQQTKKAAQKKNMQYNHVVIWCKILSLIK